MREIKKLICLGLGYLLLSLTMGCQTLSPVKSKKNMSQTPSRNRQMQILTLHRKTRGESLRGESLQYDNTSSPHFKKISKAKSKKEKDRWAILAQTGEYQVLFEFLETLSFTQRQTQKAYYSWATEYIFPLENTPNFISLQHILVMKAKGMKSPQVVKHWRQDWSYQDPIRWDYKGFNTWKREKRKTSSALGKWTQFVYQVDDSPRYQGIGKWQHYPEFSRWISEKTTRPLPRREYTVRSDYQMMTGTNTVTVMGDSWFHEQENDKVVVNPKSFEPIRVIAKELGLNRYLRIKGFDFSAGENYWNSTKSYWSEVRSQWKKILRKRKKISLKKKSKGKKLYETHFEYAKNMVHQKPDKKIIKPRDHAKKTIQQFLKK